MIPSIDIDIANPTVEPLAVGLQGEKYVQVVRFHIGAWRETYGAGGGAVLLVQRPGDEEPYVTVTEQDGDVVTWDVSETDTGRQGRGFLQLLYIGDGHKKKSPVLPVAFGPSLGTPGEMPEPYDGFLEKFEELAARVSADAEKAAIAAETGDEILQAAGDLQEALDGVAQEPTAQDILGELRGLAEVVPNEASRAARAAVRAEDILSAIVGASGQAEGGYLVIYGDGLLWDNVTRVVQVDKVDELRTGDMRLVTSNAVSEVVGNVQALLASI